MSLLDAAMIKNIDPSPYLNTGTILDIALGQFEQGLDNKWILNGGLAPITGVCGRASTYKSTIVDSLIAQILLRYPAVEVWKHDSEMNSFGLQRFDRMAGEVVSSRIRLTNQAIVPLPEFMEGIKRICENKVKNQKDYIVETPFQGVETPIKKIYVPTIIDVDSFSGLRSMTEQINADKTSVEDSSRNMDDMQDGKIKSKLMLEFARLASQYGLYFILTAHVDDQYDLDPRKPAQKQLQFLRYGDRLKRVGSQYEFYCNVLLQGTAPTPILDSQKGPEYPNGNGMNVDINELAVKILRCKTNAGGTTVPLVMSQNIGLLGSLTNYHFLKNQNDFGFIRKGHNRYPVLNQDVMLHRNSIIDTLSGDYQTCRALEILAQLKWVQSYWDLKSQPVNLDITVEKLVDKIIGSNSVSISDILNSRGYWSYSLDNKTKDPREYMSLYDILNILNS